MGGFKGSLQFLGESMTLHRPNRGDKVTPHLTVEQKRAIHRLRGRGLSLRQVAREVGCTAPGVVTVLERTPVVCARPDRWLPGPSRLQLAEREEISLGLLAGLSFAAIAHSIGRSPSTVS